MNDNSLKRSTPHTESPVCDRPATRLKPNIPMETAANVLDDATHTNLDKAVLAKFPNSGPTPGKWGAYLLLIFITLNSEGCIDPKYGGAVDVSFLEENPDLQAELWKAWEAKSFKHIRNLKILRPPQPIILVRDVVSHDQEKATEDSWERTYIGQATDALWTYITRHYEPNNTKVYAHYAAIVQSSGMGKSRTVDELGKCHFSIPMNLRDAKSTEFPPADHGVRDFLVKKCTQAESYKRCYCFLTALFQHVEHILDGPLFDLHLDDSKVAEEFRRLMTVGQTMKEHNMFRREFYNNVVRIAEEQIKAPMDTDEAERENDPTDYSYAPFHPCNKLVTALNARKHQQTPMLPPATLKSKKASGVGTAGGEPEVPLVILTFDEAHTLTDREGVREDAWSKFSVLQHVLRALHRFPLFSLFLSTTGKISQFTSAKDEDVSSRVIRGQLALIQPFTDLGFDTLAKPVSLEDDWSLEKVTTDSHIAHLGRPLFGSRYDAGKPTVREDIVLFAVGKLLNADPATSELTREQALACLSQRLPIEFNSTTYLSQATERGQVEGHMRVCLKIDAAFESMTTVSASEPLLSEAAYAMMSKPLFDAPKQFRNVLEGFAVHKGDRGEFVGLLLLTLARDKAVGTPDQGGRPRGKCRFFDAASFVSRHLFRDPVDLSRNSVISRKSAEALQELQNDFPDAKMHFNHFVKLHDYKSIDKLCLLLLMTRAAGILCANNFSSIDAINVFLRSGTKLTLDNLGLILYQIKNDSKYTHDPKKEAFEAMDPFQLGILNTGDAAVPLIRIFFALAAKTPHLVVTRHASTSNYNAIVYDIWCAGVSSKVLNPVNPQTDIWDSLLQASYGWKDLYKTKSNTEQDLRRSMNPGAAYDEGHWSRWTVRGTNDD